MPFVRFSDVEEKSVQFLWEPYIAKKKVTLLAGHPGTGKTYLGCAIMAALTRGLPLPGEGVVARGPINCAILSTEDDVDDILKPRVRRLGGDQTRLFSEDKFYHLDEAGFKRLAAQMEAADVRYIHIDSIQAYLPPGASTKEQKPIRDFLTMFREIVLVPLDASGIVTMHYRKPGKDGDGGSGPAYTAINGTIDSVATARSVMMTIRNNSGQSYLAHAKTNYGREGVSWEYAVSDQRPWFEWLGSDPRSADELLRDSGKKPNKTTQALEWLDGAVPVMGIPLDQLRAMAEEEGHAWRTVERAYRIGGWRVEGRGSSAVLTR